MLSLLPRFALFLVIVTTRGNIYRTCVTCQVLCSGLHMRTLMKSQALVSVPPLGSEEGLQFAVAQRIQQKPHGLVESKAL